MGVHMDIQYYSMISEPLFPLIKPFSWEIELFNSKPVRRLKQLSHFGAGSIISPVVHTRYEHTIGVWKLAAYFFPDDILLRVAAILHDVGHLPFSHSVEKTLGFNHHILTENLILEKEIRPILNKCEISPSRVIDFLDKPSVLTGKERTLGLDHLDSFFRDTYMFGEIDILPKHILPKLTCLDKGIETDVDTGLYLVRLIKRDHELFLSPLMVGVDKLLAEAVKRHWEQTSMEANKEDFVRLTDSDVLTALKSSKSKEATRIIHTLLYSPEKIMISERTGLGYPIHVRKVYNRIPLCNGLPLTDTCDEAKKIMEDLSDLEFELEVTV